ncbi:MAG: accessory gene regulator B family protein [Bacillota bacterium]|nr:accessory gene regulator B family protein [Bacillota bacterium]
MIHKLSLRISDFYKNADILKVDQEIYTYGVELILGDIFNLLILFIVSCILNRIVEMVVWSSVFLLSRRFTGGFHAPTHLLCILTTQTGFIASYFICERLSPSVYILLEDIIVVIGIVVLIVFGPVGNPKKPVTAAFYNKKKKDLIMFLFVITEAFLIIIELCSGSKILLYFFLSYLFVVILVPIGYIDNKIRCGTGKGVVSN